MADAAAENDGVPVEPYRAALVDANPRVVLQGIIGLQRLNAKDAAPAIFAASRNWKDEGVSPRLMHTAMQALVALENIPASLAAAEDAATRKLALLVLCRIHQMEVVNSLLSSFGKSTDPDHRFDVLSALARLSFKEKPWDLKSWWNTRPDDRGPYYEPVEWEGSARIRPAIEKGFGMIAQERQNELLEVLAKNRLPVAELKLAGVDPALAALGSKKPGGSQLMLLVDAAKDSKRPFAQRLDFYKALAKAGEKESLAHRLAVLAVWTEDQNAVAEVSRHVSDFVNSPERGKQIGELRKIAAKQSNAASRIAWMSMLTVLNSPLADAKAKERVKKEVVANPREVGFFQAIENLRLTGFEAQIQAGLNWDNSELVNAAKAAKSAVAGSGHVGRKVAEIPMPEVTQAAMSGKGDTIAGERLYTSQGCIACHSVDPKAEQKGPYLGASGAKFTRDYLIESILDPNKVVAQGFQTSLLRMKDGTVKMGFVTAEADGVVELRDIAGQVSKVKRTDVSEETHLPNSMMPPGLAGNLTVEEFTSLIEYLVPLKSTGG
jgi:putative heme-binding domain-containing protein